MKIRQTLIVVISAVCAMAQGLSAERVMRLSGIEVAPLSADTVVSGMLWDFSGSKVMGSGVLQYISWGYTAFNKSTCRITKFRSVHKIPLHPYAHQ